MAGDYVHWHRGRAVPASQKNGAHSGRQSGEEVEIMYIGTRDEAHPLCVPYIWYVLQSLCDLHIYPPAVIDGGMRLPQKCVHVLMCFGPDDRWPTIGLRAE